MTVENRAAQAELRKRKEVVKMSIETHSDDGSFDYTLREVKPERKIVLISLNLMPTKSTPTVFERMRLVPISKHFRISRN